MELSQNEIFQKQGTKCVHCGLRTLIPYEYDFSRVSYGYNILK